MNKLISSLTAGVKSSAIGFLAVIACLVFETSAFADVNVLIIGSTHDKAADLGFSSAKSKPFTPTQIRTELQNILQGVAGLGTVNVVLEERYRSDYSAADYNYAKCVDLVSWFHHPYPANAESARWANLRGQAGTNWNYVIVIGDPYTMEYLPGLYTHGVSLIADEVAKGTAQTVLLMPWPSTNSISSVANYKEVVYRTGNTTGCKVAPAALAWQAAGSTRGANHPDNNGAYIAAATIYSTIWTQNAAVASTYNYNDSLADTAYNTVTNNIGVQQYTGLFPAYAPFQFRYDKRRDVGLRTTFKSSDWGMRDALGALLVSNKLSWYEGSNIGSTWMDDTYPTLSATHVHHYDFPGNDNGMDNDTFVGRISYRDLTHMEQLRLEQPTNVKLRYLPVCLQWAQIHKLYPAEKPIQGQHYCGLGNNAAAAYMYTMFSGRCPIGPKPNPVTAYWDSCRIGYETAWRLGRVQGRAPGFRTLPSSASRLKMAPGQTETLTVQFVLPLQSNVTVNVSVANTNVATVSPAQLTFTPADYTSDQQVLVTCLGNADASSLIRVNFNTVSADEICSGLSDSWDYNRNFSPVITQSSWVDVNPITLPTKAWVNVTATDPEGDPRTYTWSKVSGPGTATFSPNSVTNSYRSQVTFSKPGTYVLKVMVSDGTSSVDGGDVTVQVLNAVPVANPQSVIAFQNAPKPITLTATDANGDPLAYVVWDDPLHGTLTGTGSNLVYTSAGGYLGSDSFTFLVNDGYGNSSPATVTITVNAPNTPPVVDAGTNQTVIIQEGTVLPWTPAMIATAGWYDGADTDTITASSGAVSQWQDKSGNSLHLGQSTASNRPATGATINGINALDFADDYMTTASNPFGTTVSNAFVITVHKVDSTANGTLFSLTGSETAANRWNSHAPYGGSLYFDCGGIVAPNRISAPYGVSAGDVVLASFYGSTADNVQQVYKNGSILTNDSTGHAVNTVSNRICVGGVPGGLVQDTTIGEFIVIKGTVTVATRQKLEGYLAHKWGLTASLPAGHPYKNAAPTGIGLGAVANLAGSANDAEGDSLTKTWSITSGPGSVVFGNASALTTTATFAQTGIYIFKLTSADAYSQSFDEVTVTVTDSLGNSAPAAVNASITTGENVPAGVTLSATDAQNDVLTYSIVTPPAHGTLGGAATNLTYTPTAGYSGSDSFTYKVNDGVYDSNLATVSITVISNQTPVIVVDSPTTNAPYLAPYGGTIFETTVTDDGYPLSPGTVTLGWSRISGPGTVTFESPTREDTAIKFGANGTYVVRLTASDGAKQASRDITLVFGIYPTDGSNQGPQVGRMATLTGMSGIPVLLNDGIFAIDDSLPYGTLMLQWQMLSGPGVGVFADPTVSATTFVCDTPGTYILRLIGDDGQAKAYDDVTVTITGIGNLIPVANAQTVSVTEDTTKAITLSGSDGNSNPLTYKIVTTPLHGTLSGSASNLIYTPEANYNGSDSFTFKVNDGITDSLTAATVSITVTTVNDPPAASAMSVTTDEDMRLPITLAGSDADGDALTFSIVSQPEHGTMSGSGAGVKYTPVANFNGSDAFTFRVTDPSGLFSEAVVSITVSAINDVPVANPQSVLAVENTPKLIVLTGTDADNDQLTYAIFAQPLHGTLDTSSLPNVSYTPDTNYFGADFFTFTVNDGKAASIVATVSMTVQPVGLSSVDSIRGDSQNTVTYPLGYFANVGGIVGGSGTKDFRTVTDVVLGHGLPILPPGAVITNAILRYEVTALNGVTSQKLDAYLLDTVNPDSSGTSFFYNGPSNTTATAKYINSVTGIGVKQVVLNSAALDLIKSYYGGDHIPDRLEVFFRLNLDTAIAAGSLLRYSIATGESQNTLELQYYIATNGVPTNTPPVANAQSVTNAEDTAKSITLTGSDADGNPLTYAIVAQPAHGTLSGIAPDVTYTPAANYSGSDSFTFSVSDPSTSSGQAVVSITVTAVNDAPVVNAGTDQTVSDADGNGSQSVTLNGSGSSDIDGTISSYVWTEGATPIATGVNPAVVLAVGTHTLTLTVTDNGGATGTDTVLITIVAVGLPSPWQNQNIGTVELLGSASYSNGTFTVLGAGAGVAGKADALNYVNQPASGDCDIKLRVASLVNAGASGQAGVMIRETLANGAREAGVWVTPANISFTYRTTTAGKTSVKTASGAAPRWVRLIRTGNSYAAYYGSNGTTWTQIGTPVNITMVNNVYMGFGVSSGSTNTLATGTMDNVTAAP